jgi:hypothetical protein
MLLDVFCSCALIEFMTPYQRGMKGAGITLKASVSLPKVGGRRPFLASQTQLTEDKMATLRSKSLATGCQAR